MSANTSLTLAPGAISTSNDESSASGATAGKDLKDRKTSNEASDSAVALEKDLEIINERLQPYENKIVEHSQAIDVWHEAVFALKDGDTSVEVADKVLKGMIAMPQFLADIDAYLAALEKVRSEDIPNLKKAWGPVFEPQIKGFEHKWDLKHAYLQKGKDMLLPAWEEFSDNRRDASEDSEEASEDSEAEKAAGIAPTQTIAQDSDVEPLAPVVETAKDQPLSSDDVNFVSGIITSTPAATNDQKITDTPSPKNEEENTVAREAQEEAQETPEALPMTAEEQDDIYRTLQSEEKLPASTEQQMVEKDTKIEELNRRIAKLNEEHVQNIDVADERTERVRIAADERVQKLNDQLGNTRSQTIGAEQEKNELRTQLAEQGDKLSAADQKTQEVERERDDLREQVQDLDHKLAIADEGTKTLELERDDLRKKVHEKDAELTAVNKRAHEKERECEELGRQLADHKRNSTTAAKQQADECKREREELRRQLFAANRTSRKDKALIARLEKQLKDDAWEHERQLCLKEMTIASVRKTAESHLKTHQKIIDKYEKDLETKASALASKVDELADAKDQLKNETIRREGVEKDARATQQEATELREKIARHEGTIKEANNINICLTNDLTQSRKNFEILTKTWEAECDHHIATDYNLGVAKDQLKTLKTECDTASSTISQLLMNVENAKAEEIDQLKLQLRVYQNLELMNKEPLEELKAQLEATKGENLALKLKLDVTPPSTPCSSPSKSSMWSDDDSSSDVSMVTSPSSSISPLLLQDFDVKPTVMSPAPEGLIVSSKEMAPIILECMQKGTKPEVHIPLRPRVKINKVHISTPSKSAGGDSLPTRLPTPSSTPSPTPTGKVRKIITSTGLEECSKLTKLIVQFPGGPRKEIEVTTAVGTGVAQVQRVLERIVSPSIPKQEPPFRASPTYVAPAEATPKRLAGVRPGYALYRPGMKSRRPGQSNPSELGANKSPEGVEQHAQQPEVEYAETRNQAQAGKSHEIEARAEAYMLTIQTAWEQQ
jgi:hypothetical protein